MITHLGGKYNHFGCIFVFVIFIFTFILTFVCIHLRQLQGHILPKKRTWGWWNQRSTRHMVCNYKHHSCAIWQTYQVWQVTAHHCCSNTITTIFSCTCSTSDVIPLCRWVARSRKSMSHLQRSRGSCTQMVKGFLRQGSHRWLLQLAIEVNGCTLPNSGKCQCFFASAFTCTCMHVCFSLICYPTLRVPEDGWSSGDILEAFMGVGEKVAWRSWRSREGSLK